MGKIAFVFSGQGDQFPGMGKELAECYPAASAVFDMCDKIRPGTSEQCFRGTAEELMETRNTQPCLFAMELAAASVLSAKGIKPDFAAGFSLGEVSACAFAGIVDMETGFRLVCKRGVLMQEDASAFDTSMAAVIRLPANTVEEICGRFSGIYPVNYNCPGQITVSGLSEQMPDFSSEIKKAGGRTVPIKVNGAFHSPFMKRAADEFGHILENVTFNKSDITVYSNATAEPYTSDPASLLSRQICSPVRWEEIIRSMIASGADTFIEIGPGKTLSNMICKTDKSVKTYSVSELPLILSEVKSC